MPILYHYTSIKAFANIWQGEKLWLSQAFCTGDPSEFSAGVRCMVEELTAMAAGDRDGLTPFQQQMVTEVLRELEIESRRPEQHAPYVLALSPRRDDPFTWKTRCPRGNGILIALETDRLQDEAGLQDAELAPTVYGSASHIALMQTELVEIASDLERRWQQSAAPGDPPRVSGDEALQEIVRRVITRLKHQHYQPENEIRLIVPRRKAGRIPRIREEEGRFRSFLEVKFPKTAVREIILGRGEEQRHNFVTLARGMELIDVKCSQVAY
ncbi:MAG: hypothetical protein HOP28_06220 [Gemmatimonadales bacterium]|nr:hypothetical protein [Gemmatimonadales bacterium]